EKGYLSRSIGFSTVNASLESLELTPILHQLVTQTSLPLQAVESHFAIDSSGFCTSRFSRWYDVKYGRMREEADWVKVHLACGTKTHIVTAVRIEGKNANDSPQFGPLTKATAENFRISEMSGDKAYSSVENLETVDACGGIPFIAFKSN